MSLKRLLIRFLLDRYKSNKQAAADTSLEASLRAARSVVEKSKYCFLITHGSEGGSNARWVEPIVEPDFTVWIGTSPKLRKVQEVMADSAVTLAFGSEKDQANLILKGQARVVDDMQMRRKHWLGHWRLFFPDGPQGDDYVLLKFEPQCMEVLSFKKAVIPEPFGLSAVQLDRDAGGHWQLRGRQVTS